MLFFAFQFSNIGTIIVVVIRYYYHYDGDNDFCDFEQCQRQFCEKICARSIFLLV